MRPLPPQSELSQLLRGARERSGLKIARIAADAEVSVQALQHWEAGRVREPPLRPILRLARVLGIPLEELEAAALASQAGEVRDAEIAAGRARAEALGGGPPREEPRGASGDT